MYPHIPMHIARSRNAGSLGLSFTLFIVFQSACTNLHSYQQSVRVLIDPKISCQHSCQHFIVFINFSHSSWGAEELHCVLIFLSLRTNEVSQLSGNWTFSTLSWSVGWSLLSTFSIVLAVFSVLFWQSPLYILVRSMWEVFFFYLVLMYFIQMKMTENGVRSKVKIMVSAINGQDIINLRRL